MLVVVPAAIAEPMTWLPIFSWTFAPVVVPEIENCKLPALVTLSESLMPVSLAATRSTAEGAETTTGTLKVRSCASSLLLAVVEEAGRTLTRT